MLGDAFGATEPLAVDRRRFLLKTAGLAALGSVRRIAWCLRRQCHWRGFA
jgi:hypothetical protein